MQKNETIIAILADLNENTLYLQMLQQRILQKQVQISPKIVNNLSSKKGEIKRCFASSTQKINSLIKPEMRVCKKNNNRTWTHQEAEETSQALPVTNMRKNCLYLSQTRRRTKSQRVFQVRDYFANLSLQRRQ